MLNKSYSYSRKRKNPDKLTRANRSLISFKKSKWKPKGDYNPIKTISKDIEFELKMIERVKRKKMELDERYFTTRKELIDLKKNYENYKNEAVCIKQSYSNKLKHDSFNKEVVSLSAY